MDFNLDWLLDTDYAQPGNFLIIASILLCGIFLRYLILAIVYHELVYKKLGDSQPYRRLHQQIKIPHVKKEIWYSFLGAIIFSISGTILLICWQQGYTKLYTEIKIWDMLWVPGSFFMALFVHETYYYWLHRWMHRPKVLRKFHHIHHNSLYTSSFTSFSFHPIEAVFQAVFLPVLVLFLPMHFTVLLAMIGTMSITAVINHAGVEVYSSSAIQSPIAKWMVGATHHDMHHLKFRCNFGLYFTFWDVWMHTEDAGFRKRFLEHTSENTLQKKSVQIPDWLKVKTNRKMKFPLTVIVLILQIQFTFAQTSIQSLQKTGDLYQLMVSSEPFLKLVGELGNSTASTMESIEPVWARLKGIETHHCFVADILGTVGA